MGQTSPAVAPRWPRWNSRGPLWGRSNPMVTGVLPLALEDATKTIQVFLLTGKEYVCLMTMHGDVNETRLRGVLEEVVGDIFKKQLLRAGVRCTLWQRVIT